MNNKYSNCCPFCEGKINMQCRCLAHNRICVNGHESWFCHQHNHYVLGEHNHSEINTCEGKETKEV